MLAAVVLKDGKVAGEGISGVRRAGGTEAAGLEDPFSLGAGTKAMTAMLLAVLVEEGYLTWGTTVGEVFDKTVDGMDPGWRTVTLDQLLMNHAGVSTNLDSVRLIWPLLMGKGTAIEQRMGLAMPAMTRPPVPMQDGNFSFMDLGYTFTGAMAEKVTGRAWEDLIQEKVFRPLGIASAGFGISSKAGKADRLQGHQQDGTPGRWLMAAIPAALVPAGTVHMTMSDWAKFVMAHLRGDATNPKRECVVIRPAKAFILNTGGRELS